MKISGNTILITGGTSGIGLELASQFLKLGNTVIITGRDQTKLDDVRRKLPELHAVQSDVSDPKSIPVLFEKITKEFPQMNVLINNAGIMRRLNLHSQAGDLEDITKEIEINLMGPIRMVKQFLPALKTQATAAIVNVSSGLAFIPFAIAPVYSATKAGLHSYTQTLRLQLKKTNVKVFELAPPATETPLLRGDFTAKELSGVKPMPVQTLAQHAIKGIKNDKMEIRPGLSNVLKLMSRITPQFMLNQLGKSVDDMLAESGNWVSATVRCTSG
jgi:uncharacterized oxidoreductase